MEHEEERVDISMRDIDRLKIIYEVLRGHLRQRQAAQQIGLSRRQVIRLCRRVQQEGNRGIMHRLQGQPSNHQVDSQVLEQAISALHDPLYDGFGPTLANEKLDALYGLKLSTSALRKAMLQTELWMSRTYAFKHRSWRERRNCVGELVQLDGSDHDWFEGRGPRCVLIVYIDDATSRILYGEFVDVEDTLTLLTTTGAYLGRHGRPLAFYVDKDSIYKVNRQATVEEELQDLHPITQFTRAMGELGIEVICADSPQAKGRVERSFGTHQDRLVKELRLEGISDKETANRFLWTTYLPAHNARFAVAPANTTDAHRSLLKTHRLEEILSIRTERTLGKDYTLRFLNQFFQVPSAQPLRVRPGARISVEIRLDGSAHLRFKDQYLDFKSITKRPVAAALARTSPAKSPKPQGPSRPALNHPWRNYPSGRQLALFEAGAARG
jgi:transposase